jgi:hypothetical protein
VNELESKWKEVAVAVFKVQSQHLPIGRKVKTIKTVMMKSLG